MRIHSISFLFAYIVLFIFTNMCAFVYVGMYIVCHIVLASFFKYNIPTVNRSLGALPRDSRLSRARKNSPERGASGCEITYISPSIGRNRRWAEGSFDAVALDRHYFPRSISPFFPRNPALERFIIFFLKPFYFQFYLFAFLFGHSIVLCLVSLQKRDEISLD